MKAVVKDSKTFITWWAMVQEKPSLLSKAKQKLGPWRLLDEHFEDGAWEAVAGLARLLQPDSVEVALEGDAPWLLPGLLVVLEQLQKLECECRVKWRRDWHLRAGASPTTEALLRASSPTTLALELDEHEDPAALASLPGMVASLARISCSVNLFLESHFLGHSDPAVSDPFLLPCLGDTARVRFRRLSAHLGPEATARFVQEAAAADRASSDDDEDEVFLRVRATPMVQAKAAIRYLEVLRVRISSVGRHRGPQQEPALHGAAGRPGRPPDAAALRAVGRGASDRLREGPPHAAPGPRGRRRGRPRRAHRHRLQQAVCPRVAVQEPHDERGGECSWST
nr:uncharacterized protein LOC113809248 [Penaeus vannamei]